MVPNALPTSVVLYPSSFSIFIDSSGDALVVKSKSFVGMFKIPSLTAPPTR